jgi:hypothetical protein
MLLGVASEHLVDGVLHVGKPNVVGLLQQADLLGGIVAELGAAVTVPDRRQAVTRAAEAEVSYAGRYVPSV